MSIAIVWFRNDLRLGDHAALDEACRHADGCVPLYIDHRDPDDRWAAGAASRAWLHRSLAALDHSLQQTGSRLLLRRGDPVDVLERLLPELPSITSVHCLRRLEPAGVAIDRRVRAWLEQRGIDWHCHDGNNGLLRPEALATAQGTPYRVFTPFWKRLAPLLEQLPATSAAPSRVGGPALRSLPLDALELAPTPAWDRGFWEHWTPGEAAAAARLQEFVDDDCTGYREARDRPDHDLTSRLSPHLHFGEISARQIVQAVQDARVSGSGEGHLAYLRELGWREFSQHLLWHFPASPDSDLDPRFREFRWAEPDAVMLRAWQQGRTGVPIVDAGMRQLWQTGWMHNRVRMVVASFLTKHLRYHWLHGARWFWDTLVDADLGNNTQGWQWCAGTGVDAAPYFRVFNPVLQGQRFDPHGDYVRRWVPELERMPAPAIHAPWMHPALAARLAPTYRRAPIVDLQQGRVAALQAWAEMRGPGG